MGVVNPPLLIPGSAPGLGANCTNMVGTLMIRRVLSQPVPPDGTPFMLRSGESTTEGSKLVTT